MECGELQFSLDLTTNFGSVIPAIIKYALMYTDCGIPYVVHKKVNDTEFDVTIEQQPWMVSLGRFVGPTRWEHECGGSLITNRHVLTAAHCFDEIKETNQLKG